MYAQTTYSKIFYVSGSNDNQYVKFEITTKTANISDTGNYYYQKINFDINCTLKITFVNLPSQTSIYGNITFEGSQNSTPVTTYFPTSGSISTTTANLYTYTTDITTSSNSTINAYYENLTDKNLQNNTSILSLANFSLATIKFTMANYTEANSYKGDYSFENYNNDSTNYLISTSNYSLPIVLSYFGAIQNNNSIDLNWTTTAEINNNYFVVLRSFDGNSYDSIAKINGNGTSTLSHQYKYTDNNYSSGTNYYKLKQVDFDGNFTYSDIISIYMNASNTINNNFTIYPNPGNGNINITGASNNLKSYYLYNINGALIEKNTINSNNFTLKSGLPPSLYILKFIMDDNQTKTIKYILK